MATPKIYSALGDRLRPVQWPLLLVGLGTLGVLPYLLLKVRPEHPGALLLGVSLGLALFSLALTALGFNRLNGSLPAPDPQAPHSPENKTRNVVRWFCALVLDFLFLSSGTGVLLGLLS